MIYDTIIIGSGPAGITSAIYLKRANKNILLLDGTTPGGKLLDIDKISNFPSYTEIAGPELATKLYEQITYLNIEHKIEYVNKITDNLEVITNNGKYKTKSIILATGKSIKTLNLDNEIRLIGKGISYCATCDGYFYRNKIVGVVGNNKKTKEDALYLSNICKEVLLFTDNLKVEKDNIIIIKEKITKINGEDKLESVTAIKDYKLNGLFIIDGNNNDINILNNNIITKDGYIIVDNHFETNVPNIYAIGDCIKKDLYQIITSMSDGANAAHYLTKK